MHTGRRKDPHPDLMGPYRPGPRGFPDMQIPIGGRYLVGAGCHGGPGITFIPGYNAGHQVLEDASVSLETSQTR